MNVAATGTWSPRANARSAPDAFRRSTPFPASTSGRSEEAIRSAAWAIASSVGSGKYVRPGRSGRASAGTAVAARFSGSSMWVGPGFSRAATRNAFRTISGIASTRSTRVFHFVTGSTIRTMSTT